jgi:hypothetical protein
MASRDRGATVAKRPNAKDEDSEIAKFVSGSVPPAAHGYLNKLSKKGKWQKRFFQLRGPFLM